MNAENVGYGGCSSNHRQISFIEIAERRRLGLTFHFPHNRFCRIRPLLHRYLRHALQRHSMFVYRESQVSDNIDVWKISDRKIWTDFYPSATVSFSASAVRQRFSQRR